MSSKVTALLEILGDGEWHRLAGLRQQLGLAKYKMHEITEFLCMFDFAVFDEKKRSIKVSTDFKVFLMQT